MADAVRQRSMQFFTPPFLVAVVMLIGAALLAGPVANRLNLRQAKSGLALKKALSTLDEASLGHYRVLERRVLDTVVVEALGTERYISWILEDTSARPEDPSRFANLLVTYYSGGHNLVPHTPDVCYLGAGYQPARPHENMLLDVPIPEAVADGGLPVRVLTFGKTAVFDREESSVVYTFFCNGKFVNTRTGVRLLINKPSNTYAFFSKVEVSFQGATGKGATREQCLAGARKLFTYVLPELMRNHWPDFEVEEERARASAAKG